MRKNVLIALGGNALLQAGESGTDLEQIAHVRETAVRCLEIIEDGYSVVLTHGNGPQVGAILLKNEIAKDTLPPMPLDICGAESQGLIGYMIQREFYNILEEAKISKSVGCVLTQVLVNQNDPAFAHPTKPIGPFYKEEEKKELEKEKGWTMIYQEGKGYRRVVPSPIPITIVEKEIIKTLMDNGIIVIACGGGGIPVIREENGTLKGVEAVIDKDRTAAVLGRNLGVDVLMILTDVDKVAINFGKKDQKFLDKLTVEQAKRYIQMGHFGKGSMEPKVQAACEFVENGGSKAIITSLNKSKMALDGHTGTIITL
jgi:carbamate kinase